MAVGYFGAPDAAFYSRMIIYQKPSTSPTKATTTPVYRTPVAPPRNPAVMPTTTTATAAPISGKVVTTTTTSGDAFVSGATSTTGPGAGSGSTGASATPTGMISGTTATGTESTGGGGSSGVDSRLLDLLSGAFQQQDIQQGYAPQSVSSDAIAPSGKGTNPMAVVVLAIIVMAGIYFWTHRRGGKA